MFHARSMSRSPAERYWPSNLPRFSCVTRSLTKFKPCSVQDFRDASPGSKSTIVIRFGSTLMCLSKMGSVHRATAPKPTNKMRFENVSIRYPRNHDKERRSSKTRHTTPIACCQPHDKHQQIV